MPRPRDYQGEDRVARCLREGLSNKEIESQLGLSKGMVSYFMGRLMSRACLNGKADERRLVIWALTKWKPAK